MRHYRYTMSGTAAEGQTWTVTGVIASYKRGEFAKTIDAAQRDAFIQLTRGEAEYGKPGVGCDGPYEVGSFSMQALTDARVAMENLLNDVSEQIIKMTDAEIEAEFVADRSTVERIIREKLEQYPAFEQMSDDKAVVALRAYLLLEIANEELRLAYIQGKLEVLREQLSRLPAEPNS